MARGVRQQLAPVVAEKSVRTARLMFYVSPAVFRRRPRHFDVNTIISMDDAKAAVQVWVSSASTGHYERQVVENKK